MLHLCSACGRAVFPQDIFPVVGGEVCLGCSHRVLTCSRCGERVLDEDATTFSRNCIPETICHWCLRLGENMPRPYWER